MTGDGIDIKLGEKKLYAVKFEEVHWMEESGECTSYGDEAEFNTYADCVAIEQKRIFYPILGCQVPWIAAPHDPGMCKGRVHITEKAKKDSDEKIIHEIERMKASKTTEQFQKCLKPCRELRAFSTFRSTESIGLRFTGTTTLAFQRKVKVTRYMWTYGHFDLVVEIGSSLGLWIGLSALGVFDLLKQAGHAIKKKIGQGQNTLK